MTVRLYTRLADEALERAHLIASNLLPSFEISMLTLGSKLPFKALSLREVLMHRMADLALSAAETLKEKRVVSSATLSRAAMETMARTLELDERLSAFLKGPDIKTIDDYLMMCLFGSRTDQAMPQATNILGAINRATKLIPEFRGNYDRLCEYAHPNWSGGLGSFAAIDKQNHRVDFKNDRRSGMALQMIGFILNGTLEGFSEFYNKLADTIRDFNDHFEGKG